MGPGGARGGAERAVKRVVLAYSGGLDTSVCLRWLRERYGCEVIAFTADVGQGEDLEAIRRKALACGASKVHVCDLREEFVRDFVFPALRANAVYEGGYLLGTALARPLIARKQVEVALQEGADALAHGATSKGNDQVRFEIAYLQLAPQLQVIAPWRIWEFRSRSDLIRYARERGIPVEATPERPYSVDCNLLHTSFEGGVLEDPWREPPRDTYRMAVPPEEAPDRPEVLEVDFEEGVPVAVNGQRMSPAQLLGFLNRVGGAHGVGRVDLVEDRYVGMKSRGVYEAPGGTILHVCHRALEGLTLDREVMYLRDSLVPTYARLVYFGYWFSPEREFLQRAIDWSQRSVSGTVRVKLYRGSCQVVGRRSERSLYRPELASFERPGYDPRQAEGFIRLNALRLMLRSG